MEHFKSLCWICYNIAFVLCFCFLASRHVRLRSLTRDWTHIPALEGKVLTTGPPGKSHVCTCFNYMILKFSVQICTSLTSTSYLSRSQMLVPFQIFELLIIKPPCFITVYYPVYIVSSLFIQLRVHGACIIIIVHLHTFSNFLHTSCHTHEKNSNVVSTQHSFYCFLHSNDWFWLEKKKTRMTGLKKMTINSFVPISDQIRSVA